MKAIKPSRLEQGDKVALLTPAGKAREQQINIMKQSLEKMGLVVLVHSQNYLDNGYFAGTDQQRADAVNEMFADKSIKAICCVRGGYGCTRILDKIDYNLIKDNPKILTGMSDITALQHAILKKTGLITYSAPMSCDFKEDDGVTHQHFKEAMFNDSSIVPLGEVEVLKTGVASGRLIGGNLCLLEGLLGTEYDNDYDNCILFFEEVSEYMYAIDRILQHLKNAKKLDKVAGVIVGENAYKEDDAYSGKFNQHLLERFENNIVPIVVGAHFGHKKRHITIPIGQKARLTVNENGAQLDLL